MEAVPYVWVGTDELIQSPKTSSVITTPPRAGNGIWGFSPAAGAAQFAAESPSASFIALNSATSRLYAVSEKPDGELHTYAVGTDCRLRRVGSVSSGGQGPCHVLVHPEGHWLYVSHYGDGTMTAIRLENGDLATDAVRLRHAGAGAHPERQEGSHAHSTLLSPGGGYAIVMDLGTDELRAYPLVEGRPLDEPVVTSVPAGSGPRHAANGGSYLYITCEISGSVLVVEWDEGTGRGEVVQTIAASRSSAEDALLSHLVLTDVLLVAVRGNSTISVLTIHDGGCRLELAAEVSTHAWPRHMELVGDRLVVAAEQGNSVALHPYTPAGSGGPRLGEVIDGIEIPRPMCIVPSTD